MLLGSTRNEEDRALVRSLKDEVINLGITDQVIFVVNAPFSVLYGLLGEAQVGLHTMWNEHFGISIVEMMAAGLVTVAHKSGGPLMDLIVPADALAEPLSISASKSTGYLASTAAEYAACIGAALDTYPHSLSLRERARASSLRYSDELFQQVVVKEFAKIIINV